MTSKGEPLRDAVISDCGKYRYRLIRMWGRVIDPTILWVMLNPSTADAKIDDMTIKRCMSFSRAWGFGHMLVGNVFAYRSTDPKVLRTLSRAEAKGPDNHKHLTHMAEISQAIVCAWGNPGGKTLPTALMPHTAKLHHVGMTKSGAPRHPLYLPDTTTMTRWTP